MLTRETAIARLRANGTLTVNRPANVISRADSTDPLARTLAQLAQHLRIVPATRHLAPATAQMVLP